MEGVIKKRSPKSVLPWQILALSATLCVVWIMFVTLLIKYDYQAAELSKAREAQSALYNQANQLKSKLSEERRIRGSASASFFISPCPNSQSFTSQR